MINYFTTVKTFKKDILSELSIYFQLLKPKVMYLVTFTGMIGVLLAPGAIHPFLSLIAILCIALGSGAAGAINMWYDSDIDFIMSRTRNRPIPSGKVSREAVLEFGIVLAIIAVFLMAIAINYLSAFILALSILFYVFIYTMWLKRKTPQNIVIGGIAGAFPPIIGWAVVTNSISLESIVLFLIIFIWTPPHFWALSLLNYKEYAKANVPMLPVVYGVAKTKLYILIYSIILVITSFLPIFFLKNHVFLYLLGASFLGVIFLNYARQVYLYNNNHYYRKLFKYSISYLFILFSLILICH